MFKKLIAITLAMVLVFGICACSKKSTPSNPTEHTSPSQETDPTTDHVVPFDPSVPSQTEPTGTTDPVNPEDTTTMRLVADTALRYEADEHSATYAVLLAGNKVQVAEFTKDWARIVIDNKSYYVPYNSVRGLDEYLIVIDAGHQAKQNTEKEPIGPDASETKAKVTSGTQGVATGMKEYVLNLIVAQKLQKILEQRGYKVAMIRTTHEVNMSNAERAQVANNMYADAFIRIHANGSEDSSVNGIVTVCQTKDNVYNSAIYEQCKALSTAVLDEMVSVTGAKKLYVWETDTMSGINWCTVPVTIVEMGFMSNPEEDTKLASPEYQEIFAGGMVEGVYKIALERGWITE